VPLLFYCYHSMWSSTRSQMTMRPGMITKASRPAPRNAPTMMSSLSIVVTFQASAATVSAQVSSLVRIASSEYEVRLTWFRLSVTM